MPTESNDEQLKVQKEILKWIKVTSIPQVKKLLEETLSTDQERLAYHLSTGLNSREIASKVGIRFQTITDWWDRWYRFGIAEKISVKRGERGIRSFDLEDFGIPIPKVAMLEAKKEKTNIRKSVKMKGEENEIG